MVRPAYRTHSRAKRRYKSPGGDNRTHYFKRKPQHAHCGNCGSVLAGVPALRPYQLRRLPKNQRKPTRIYGGNLCANCVESNIKNKVLQYNSQE